MTESKIMAPNNIRFNPIGIAIIVIITLIIIYASGLSSLFQSEESVNLKELLSVGIDVARKGGERVRVIRESQPLDAESKGLTQEGAAELKTNGDLQSHIQMFYGIKNGFQSLDVSLS